MKYILTYICAFVFTYGVSQESLADVIQKYNEGSIPYMSVKELQVEKNITILDARELEEYNVSHIKDAIFVGYKNFQIEPLLTKFQNKNQKIIVYCSLGVRSEDIAEQLKDSGYTNVYNLYGGIFEWKNNNFNIYNTNNELTENIHAFSKQWSKWLTKGEKTYE